MKTKFILIVLLVIITSENYAQYENRTIIPTPNAANLGMYGQIPVNLFNGLPQIEIPIYEFKSKELSCPVSLSYHAGGIKPSDHASWVGLGWSLQAGGLISRIQNDLPDEFVNYNYASNGDISNVKNGFFYNYGFLNNTAWCCSILQTEASCLFSPIINTPCDPNFRKDKAPDEFSFNFQGMSGSLFMGQDGNWKLKSKQSLNFSVIPTIEPYTLSEKGSDYPSLIKSCLTKFILIAADGVKYTFGGTSTSVEFARISSGTITGGSRDGGTIPTSWYLTKIENTSKDIISFEYTRDGYQILNYPNGTGYTYYCPTCTPGAYYSGGPSTAYTDNFTIADGITLSKITGVHGSIEFQKSKANILDYSIWNPWQLPQATVDLFDAYYWEVFNGLNAQVGYAHSTFMKLNKILVKNTENNNVKSFSFSYTENSNNRLFLNSLTANDANDVSNGVFSFGYNNLTALADVPYETIKTDHWGYYTNLDPLTGLYFVSFGAYDPTYPYNSISYYYANNYYPTAFDNSFATTYKNNRTPKPDKMQYGVLSQITYPTGGNTQFVWETNTYSKYVDQTPLNGNFHIGTIDLSTATWGPGLRISQIKSQAGPAMPMSTKYYNYYRDYVNNNYLTSGVLNSAEPNYVDNYGSSGDFTYRVWSTNNRVPLHYTNGGPITYTNIQEINSDGSYKTYTYSNHDNGYLDKLPVAGYVTDYGISAFQDFNTSTLELERGLILAEATYNSQSVILNKKTYQYNDDPNRFDEYVKKYLFENKFSISGTIIVWAIGHPTSGPPAFTGSNLYALQNFTYFPYLKAVTENNYDQNGTNPVTTVSNYTYDAYRNIKTLTTTSSDSKSLVNKFNYSNDLISGLSSTASQAKNNLISQHIINPVLESFQTKGTVEVFHKRTDYQISQNGNNISVPGTTLSANGGNALETETQYLNYDSKGNILEYVAKDGVVNSFEWGYNQVFPVVHAVNAANTYKTFDVPIDYTAQNGATLIKNTAGTETKLFENIVVTRNGNVILKTGYSGNYTISGNYKLSFDNVSHSFSYSSGTSCGSVIEYTYQNVPPGTYTLEISATANQAFGFCVDFFYPSIQMQQQTSGIKEFFYQGFEEFTETSGNSINNVVNGTGKTGSKYWNGSQAYVVPFTKPNSKKYFIQWFSFNNSKWIFNQQTFTNGMSLTGMTDDIRISPDDAQLTTYTYEPLKGVTSITNPNGKSVYYDYDGFGRLSLIRDQDLNIIKKYCYNYAGQTVDCGGYYNAEFTKVFIKKTGCQAGYSGTEVPFTVAAKKYSSQISQADADQQAMNYANANGQTYANSQTSCLPNTPVSSINYDKAAGYTVVYTNVYDNSVQYSFAIQAPDPVTVVSLGSIAQGTYNVTISTAQQNPPYRQFTLGSLVIINKSATFSNISVTSNSGNEITIGYPPVQQ